MLDFDSSVVWGVLPKCMRMQECNNYLKKERNTQRDTNTIKTHIETSLEERVYWCGFNTIKYGRFCMSRPNGEKKKQFKHKCILYPNPIAWSNAIVMMYKKNNGPITLYVVHNTNKMEMKTQSVQDSPSQTMVVCRYNIFKSLCVVVAKKKHSLFWLLHGWRQTVWIKYFKCINIPSCANEIGHMFVCLQNKVPKSKAMLARLHDKWFCVMWQYDKFYK